MAAISTYLALAGLATTVGTNVQGNINTNNANQETDREKAYQAQEIATQKEKEFTKRKDMINTQRRQLLGKGDAPMYRLGATGATGVKAPTGMGASDTLTGVTLG